MRLLNPGPVTLTDRVRGAMLREDLCHREGEFVALHQDILARLSRVYEGAAPLAAVLLTGSGTAAVEAMVGSLVPRGGRALVVINGVYGDRMAAMLEAQGKAFDVVRSDWGTPLDLGAVEARLGRGPAVTHVLAVHHETTTGRLNDLPALGAICRRHGAGLLLDAVSSFGGEALDLEGWGVEACAATANKCLHGVPGVSFVLARPGVFAERPSGATSVYLDLYWHHAEQLRGSAPFTHAVQACYALAEALREFDEAGGWRARRRRYAALAARVERGLLGLGLRPLLAAPADRSVVLSAWWLPDRVAYAALHDHLKERGFTIYAGQGKLQDKVFRVSVMGDLSDDDVGELLGHVGGVLG
jgi:2-aminoethylphosphonate-pyruvate transaminase